MDKKAAITQKERRLVILCLESGPGYILLNTLCSIVLVPVFLESWLIFS